MTRELKDRARPFSKKHRKYWIPVTGGMILIGAINVGIGAFGYDPPSTEHKRIPLVIPTSQFGGPLAHLHDAGVPDAPPATTLPPPLTPTTPTAIGPAPPTR